MTGRYSYRVRVQLIRLFFVLVACVLVYFNSKLYYEYNLTYYYIASGLHFVLILIVFLLPKIVVSKKDYLWLILSFICFYLTAYTKGDFKKFSSVVQRNGTVSTSLIVLTLLSWCVYVFIASRKDKFNSTNSGKSSATKDIP